MKPRLVCLIVAVLLAAAACENDPSDPKRFAPADCVRQPPEVGVVALRVLIDAGHLEVPIKIYEGNFDDNVVVVIDTLTVDTAQYELKPDTDYSASAAYTEGSGTVLAIDGGHLGLSYTDYDDARCWSVGRLELDLRLVEQ